MNPLVSVVIANYNSEKYIQSAIQSILNQTYQNFELIIIDDCSTDGSLSLIKTIANKDSRIRVIEQHENKGVTFTRQNGLQNANGKYVAILDADDIALPTRLEEQVSVLEKLLDVVLVTSHYKVINERGKVKRKIKKVHTNEAAIKWFMTFGNCFVHSTIMFRLSEALNVGGYDQSIKRGLDMELTSKLLTKGKIYTIPKVLCYWRSYSKSMTKSVHKTELEENYIRAVQNSIFLHLSIATKFETAQAIFYNYRKPAPNAESLVNGIDVIKHAYEKYKSEFFNQDLLILEKSFIKHFLKIYERNCKETWWNEIEEKWLKTFRAIVNKQNIFWLILKNYSQLSSRNIKNILSLKLSGKL